MMIFLQLFFEFFKAGLFAVGGGLATLPFLQDISARTGWFTTDQLADMIAVSECTPGPIGVNMATYAGFLVKGVPGAVTATLGLICPSVIVIIIVARILKKFQSNKYVQAAFYGLRPAPTGLIGAACASVDRLRCRKCHRPPRHPLESRHPGCDPLAPHEPRQHQGPENTGLAEEDRQAPSRGLSGRLGRCRDHFPLRGVDPVSVMIVLKGVCHDPFSE